MEKQFKCPHCSKMFNQKEHLKKHLNKKKSCIKCDKNFTTQYAYINGKCIYIDDYKKDNKGKPKCQRGHELIFVNGEKNKKHFRHKNSEDTASGEKTEWHCKWQGYFPITEKIFEKKNGQFKKRIADVYLEEHNIQIEIQHSKILSGDIKSRDHDYKLNSIDEIIWIIDGNTTDIILTELSEGEFIIEFGHDWKYESFKECYDYILLDIKDKIFKIAVKEVCRNTIKVNTYIETSEIVEELLENPKNIWKLWPDNNCIKPKLTLIQKGAGNGKTFGLLHDIVIDYDYNNIIVTKQHTAKEVIREEFKDQIEKKHEHIIKSIKENTEKDMDYGNQIIIEYEHNKNKKIFTIIIGTIDSFANACSSYNSRSNDYFTDLLVQSAEKGLNKILNSGFIKYAGIPGLKLNSKMHLWVDESQDLGIEYVNFIYKLMLSTKINVTVVGDKLQTLKFIDNFMMIKDSNYKGINIHLTTPINDNWRIKVKGMKERINKLVYYKKYNLPPIQTKCDLVDREEDPIEIISEPVIYNEENNTKENRDNTNKYIDTIIHKIDLQVTNYEYKPKDFLIVFPIMKDNFLANELQTRINEYWIEKLGITNTEYIEYAVLHKHQEGQSIDTQMSINSTRLMSIQSSKGDGRPIVFILQCNEKSLKLISRGDNNLIYESHFNVGLTRAEYKIYYGLQKNNDDIHKRFGYSGITDYMPVININFTIDKILKNIDSEKLIKLLKENDEKNIIQILDDIDKKSSESKKIIDWNYHCIRRAVYYNYAIFNIIKCDKNLKNNHINTVLYKISKLPIRLQSRNQFYDYLNDLKPMDQMKEMPLCKLTKYDGNIYNKYSNKIKNLMKEIQNDYQNCSDFDAQKAVILTYMIEIYTRKKYHDTTPSTIYNIINYFKDREDTKVAELLKESEIIKGIVENVMNDILKNNSKDKISWNIEHKLDLYSSTDDFKIYKPSFPIIGNDSKNVYHLVLTTDLNKLNFWDTLIQILLERILIYNPSTKGEDINKFKDKNIKTYLFILKQNNYILFDWDWDKTLTIEIKQEIKKSMIKYLKDHNIELFKYFKFIRKDKSLWKDLGSPILFMKTEFGDIKYLTDVFNSLNELEEKKKKKIMKDEYRFIEMVEDAMEKNINTYLGLNEIESWSSDSDDE